MDWKKGLLRLALASMMLACFPVPEDKEEEDEEERGDDDDDDDDDNTPFGGGDDDDDDDDDDVVGDDDDDDDDDDEPGYDADCALGAEAYCLCWTYYGYAECDDAEWGSYYDMCVTGEDGGVIECFASHVDQDYNVDCYAAITTCY